MAKQKIEEFIAEVLDNVFEGRKVTNDCFTQQISIAVEGHLEVDGELHKFTMTIDKDLLAGQCIGYILRSFTQSKAHKG